MQYRTRRRNAHKLWISVLCLVIVTGFVLTFRNSIGSLFASLSQVRHPDGWSRRALVWRIEELSSRTEYMTALEAQIEVLESENRMLRDVAPVSSQVIRARIVGRADRSLYDRVFIDKGLDAGVVPGAAVRVADATVGRVVEAYPGRALVAYLSDPGYVTDAVLGASGVPVVMRGQGGGSVEFELPREVPIETGGVLTLQSDPSSPVAIVESFTTDDRNPVRTVKARIPANVQQLRYVAVSRS